MIVTDSVGEKHIVVQIGETEKQIIKQMAELALENNGWNIAKAARSLGLKRTAMVMRIKKWGLDANTEEQAI